MHWLVIWQAILPTTIHIPTKHAYSSSTGNLMTRSGDDDDTWGTTKKLLHIHTHTWEAGGVPTLPHGQSQVLYHIMYSGQLLGSNEFWIFSLLSSKLGVSFVHNCQKSYTQSSDSSLFPGTVHISVSMSESVYFWLSNLN